MEELRERRQKDLDQILLACKKQDFPKIEQIANRLAEVGGNFILSSFELSYREVSREGAYQLLICVGVEMLLNAIIVLESPNEFICLYNKRGRPSQFENLKNAASSIIAKGFDKRKRDRLIDVLDLIQSKRNIFAHFSLGIHALYYQHYEMLNIIEYLYSRFFPAQIEAIKKIRIMKKRFAPKEHDYVDFYN